MTRWPHTLGLLPMSVVNCGNREASVTVHLDLDNCFLIALGRTDRRQRPCRATPSSRRYASGNAMKTSRISGSAVVVITAAIFALTGLSSLFASVRDGSVGREQMAGYFRAGQQAIQQGRFVQAIQEFRGVLKLDPGLSQAWINLGLAEYALGEYRRAARALQKGLEQSPDVAGANLVLGVDELKLGLPSLALPPLERAVRIDPANPQAEGALANASLALGKFLQASRAYQAAFAGGQNVTANWYHLGSAYLRMSNRLVARMNEEFQNTVWYDRMSGDLLLSRHAWESAQWKYESALALNPSDSDLYVSLGNAMLGQGKVQGAAAQYEKALTLVPDDPEALLGLAQVNLRQGRVNRGRRLMMTGRRDLETRNRNLQSRLSLTVKQQLLLGQSCFELKEYRRAADIFASAFARDWTDAEASYWLASAYMRLAARYFSSLSAQFPHSAEAHALQAENYRILGRDTQAIKEYQTASSIEPGDASFHESLGELFLDQKQLAPAEQELAKALALQPQRARSLYLMGRVCIGKGQLEQAIAYLKKALHYNPGLLEAHASLGIAYLQTGKTSLAAAQLESAASLDHYGDVHYMLYKAYREMGKITLARNALAVSQALRRKSAAAAQAKIEHAEQQ
jgi:tetratricopeptide (TPR) repeat protein